MYQTTNHERSLLERALLAVIVASAASTSMGCKGLFGAEERDEVTAVSSALTAAPLASASSGATPAASKSDCPAGRWRYDYSDKALEVMMKNTVAGKVIKEEGEFVCSIDSGKQGSIECSSQGKPVVNVVETKQAGLPMRISVELSGTAKTKFTLLDGSRMKVVSSDTSQLKVKANVELAGKAMPFPTDELLGIFGEPESVLSYKCEQGALAIKPEIAGVETDWQEFTPAK
jgi:hypothetical protein